MRTANDDVTVVIACFNYGRYLLEAVASVLEQDGGPARTIVVDDGSTDAETHTALERLPAGVEVVPQSRGGVCRARNAGLARARTPYVLVLDADDRLTPGALRALRPPLERNRRLGFAYGTMRFFGDWHGELRFPPYDPYRLLYRHTVGLSALVRQEVIEATGGFDAKFEAFEDWELWLNALAHGWRGERVDAVTLEYRRHGNTKLGGDRLRYRQAFRALRRKHAGLYARQHELARESGLGALDRLAHRLYWGPRPIPARVETFVYGRRWRARRAT